MTWLTVTEHVSQMTTDMFNLSKTPPGTDNTVAKRQKNRQHSGQKTEKQTTQWPTEKVQKDNDLQNIHIKLKNE
jgi:hypothetical protein